jgi:hypothetical protein
MPLNQQSKKSIYDTAPIAQPKDAQAAIEKRNSMFKACFSTQAGKEVLVFLEEKYLTKPVCMIDNVYYGYIREGQNSIIREIKDYIKGAK